MDGSDDAKRAAEKVLELLQPDTVTKVVAFHSVEHSLAAHLAVPITMGAPNSQLRMSPDRIRQEYRMIGEKILKRTKDTFKKAGKLIETRLIEDEDPEDYIMRVIDEENFDLIALGSKGDHSKLKEMFLGSIAQKVLNDADCDVLVVR
ncbi:MAG: universal stress protein [Promethearchaeota archaeon]|nr:MAG: universal stress protein [Candidatus Lokiarchaeota archaeon]